MILLQNINQNHLKMTMLIKDKEFNKKVETNIIKIKIIIKIIMDMINRINIINMINKIIIKKNKIIMVEINIKIK